MAGCHEPDNLTQKHVWRGVADPTVLILAAEVGARLVPTLEPVLGGHRIARLPHQLAPEALDFTRLIRPGETVGWSEATAEPVFLTRLLDAQAGRCAPFRVFFAGGTLPTGPAT